MKHSVKRILPLLSLLAAIGVIALWNISYYVEEGIAWTDWKKVVIFSIDRGDFLISGYSNVNPVDLWAPAGFIAGSKPISRIRYAAILAQQTQFTVSTVVITTDQRVPQTGSLLRWNENPDYWSAVRAAVLYTPTGDFTVPLWPFVLILLMLPARWLILRMKARRFSRVGFCRRCGYDLRATPGRCPECGTEVKPAPPARGALIRSAAKKVG